MSDQINQEGGSREKKKSFLKTTKSKVILSVAIILFAFLTVSGIALAKHLHKFGDGPGHMGFIIDRIAENLDLTATQKAQLEKIRNDIKEKMDAKKDNHETMINEFESEFRKSTIDKNKLKDLALQREQKEQEMKDFIMDKIIEFHDILTPEQRNKAMDKMKEMKNKFHDKMDKNKPGNKQEKD